MSCRRERDLTRGDRLLDRRTLAGDGSAAHVADFVDVVKGAGAMHGRAVVPDDQIVLLPFMGIDELGPGGVLRQIADKGEAFRTGRADDATDMSREINRFPAAVRVRAHQALQDRGEILQFLFAQFVETESAARIDKRMFADHILDQVFGFLIEGVIGPPAYRRIGFRRPLR